MAKIADFVKKIRTSIYGKDVREALAAGIEAINEEAVDAKKLSASSETAAKQAAEQAAAALQGTQEAAENATAAASAANAAVEAAGTAIGNCDSKAQDVDAFLAEKEAEFLARLGRKIVVTDTDPGFGATGEEGSVIFVYREPYKGV